MLKPKKVLRTLAKSLKISSDELARTLSELPHLLSEEGLEELIACAAEGFDPSDAERVALAAGIVDDRDGAGKSAEGSDEIESRTDEIESRMEVSPEAVAKLIREHLEERLRDVKPAFVAAALELRSALKLG